MSGPDDPSDDLLDRILSVDSSPCGNASLREATLAKTIGVIRFRRRMKKCVVAASLLGCYFAGMATTGFWRPAGHTRLQAPVEQAAIAPRPAPPVVAKVDRVEALRRNADRQLLQFGDVELALRDYKRVLDLTPADQRAISPERDSWLMMALKDARSKEKRYVRSKND
jgi:hypothetical protein